MLVSSIALYACGIQSKKPRAPKPTAARGTAFPMPTFALVEVPLLDDKVDVFDSGAGVVAECAMFVMLDVVFALETEVL